MAERLTFDAEQHVYRLDGKFIPSVTQVLKDEGFIETKWFNDEARVRGQLVHSATELLDSGELNWFGLDDNVFNYVRAYQNFKNESGFEPTLIEEQRFCDCAWYAGTMDRVGILNGREVLIDLKTGAKQEWWALQLAGYQHLIQKRRILRFSLELRANGTFNLVSHNDKNDVDDFLAIVRTYHRKRKGEPQA